MIIGRKTWAGRSSQARRLALEMLESRRVMTTLPYGAMPQDTAEFMLGKVAVTPVFLESSGALDTSSEDWTPALIESTMEKIQEGLDWWVDMLAAQQTVHALQFEIDTTYAATPVATRYEPISRVSNDFALWVQEFVDGVGYNVAGGLDADIRAFNHAQREKLGTDWSFTMFVVNSNNDVDGRFAAGGSFPFAFGFAGGLFLVSPSTRPASTFAHETGHMFWAKDEYAGGAPFTDRRGYYNVQNSNAADNDQSGFVQQPSIMASGPLLDEAYANHVSPPSTLAMIGWRDSDQDGVFDVLDVPLKLTGSGHYDSEAGQYTFQGAAKVGVLPNLNSEGLRNDITSNRISSIEYRVDGGAWTTIESPDVYEASLDLSIAVPASAQGIEIRAVDAQTGVTSNVFQGRMGRANAVVTPGISGFVWIDRNGNDLREAGEFGESGWGVEVLSGAGQLLNLRRSVEPDTLPDGPLAVGAVSGLSITSTGADTDGRAGVMADSAAGPGAKVFSGWSRASQSWTSQWTGASRRLQVDFGTPTSLVQIDAIGTAANSYGRIEAYDAAGNLLARFTTPALGDGQVVSMRVESAVGAIASVRVGGHAGTAVRLDNLRFGPETQLTTGTNGQYSIAGLPTGSYTVQITPALGHVPPSGESNRQVVTVTAGGVTGDVDFAFQTTSAHRQNPANPLDVNDDQVVSALDVLLIVNEINQNGPHDLVPGNGQPLPFIDVNGDAFVSALDALLIVNYINAASEGEASGASNPETNQNASTAVEASRAAAPASRDKAWQERDKAWLSLHEDLSLHEELEALALHWIEIPGRRTARLALWESL